MPSEYRGYQILQQGTTSFAIYHGSSFVAHCGTRWDCVIYIDELLQP